MIRNILRNFRDYFFKDNPGLRKYKSYALKHVNPLQADGFFNKFEGEQLEQYFQQINDKLGSIITENDTVLEVGCGTGRYLKFIETKFQNKPALYGIDVTEETILNITRKNVGPNVTLLVGDFIKDTTLQTEQFDKIYSISVLQCIPFFKVNAFFNKIKALLKKGGTGYLVFAPKKNEHSNSINSLLDFSFTAYDPKIIVKKTEEKFTVIEHGYIHVADSVFGYYIVFKK